LIIPVAFLVKLLLPALSFHAETSVPLNITLAATWASNQRLIPDIVAGLKELGIGAAVTDEDAILWPMELTAFKEIVYTVPFVRPDIFTGLPVCPRGVYMLPSVENK
jgi:hypothetical protein